VPLSKIKIDTTETLKILLDYRNFDSVIEYYNRCIENSNFSKEEEKIKKIKDTGFFSNDLFEIKKYDINKSIYDSYVFTLKVIKKYESLFQGTKYLYSKHLGYYQDLYKFNIISLNQYTGYIDDKAIDVLLDYNSKIFLGEEDISKNLFIIYYQNDCHGIIINKITTEQYALITDF
jgi:hypothetical protein